jgi:hypothetical protein
MGICWGKGMWPNPSQEWFHGYNIEHTGLYIYIYIYNMIVGCVQKVHIPPQKKKLVLIGDDVFNHHKLSYPILRQTHMEELTSG